MAAFDKHGRQDKSGAIDSERRKQNGSIEAG